MMWLGAITEYEDLIQCALTALGWVVLHVPACRRWASSFARPRPCGVAEHGDRGERVDEFLFGRNGHRLMRIVCRAISPVETGRTQAKVAMIPSGKESFVDCHNGV